MRQLYEKSGASSRFSDFAIDVRKVIEIDSLPEYTAKMHKNEEGEEVIHFLKRDLLALDDPRYVTHAILAAALPEALRRNRSHSTG